MGKIKVAELAKKVNMSEEMLIKKLRAMSIDVKTSTDLVDESLVSRLSGNSGPHIIRRKVKVVTTDDQGNKVERITTNAGGTIQKSVIHEKKQEKPTYSKEGLGVVKSNRSRNNRNVMQNIVVTQNGKKVEKEQEKPVEKVVERPELSVADAKKIVNNIAEQRGHNKPERTDRFDRQERNDKNNIRPNGNQNKFQRNNNNSKPMGNVQGDNRVFNRNSKPSDRQNRPDFKNKNQGQSSGYKVNKFIKETGLTDSIQKETRDYSTTLIDKKKYNLEKTERKEETRRQTKNANEMREQNTRMDFSKFRGMQVSEDGLMDLYDRGENRKGSAKRKKQKAELGQTKIIPLTEVELPESMSVKDFAEKLKKQASEIIKKMFSMGIMATVNQEIDFDTAFLIASEFGINATKQVVVTEEDVLFDDSEDDEKDLEARPPIVTIMGHVDHGKTSLLDKIRSSSVASGESGGITQHIGAYKVQINGREITFLDTPGHEAFSEMRARGAQVTDIVIIVVAADDGIKPQTVEAINHAKAAGVSIVVAINKIDRETANIERVKQELLEYELVPEEWGGDTICVPVSAKTGEGIETLLEMMLLVADVKELKANPNKQAKGTVIEAKLDKARGPLATVLVQRGTLNVGDTIVLGDIVGRVRNMTNDRGESVKKAGPSTPVEILGLGSVPDTGDTFYEVKDEKTAHKLIEKRKAQHRLELIKKSSIVTLDDLFNKIKDGETTNLDVIIRADVKGSAEALKESLEKLSNEEIRVRVIASNTGGITESDVTLAKLSNAIIIGFNVKAEAAVQNMADKEKVDLRLYKVIYDAIEDVEAAMKGLHKVKYIESPLGTAEVRHVFKITGAGVIAGSYVTKGKLARNAMVRLSRNNEVLVETKLESLKREKDDVKEVAEGYECGVKLEKFSDVKEGDILECYELVEEKK